MTYTGTSEEYQGDGVFDNGSWLFPIRPKPCPALKAALTVYAATPAMGLLWLETMHMRKYGEISLYVMLGAFVVYFYAGVASFRSYHYSIETLRKQLQNFRLADTKCNWAAVKEI